MKKLALVVATLASLLVPVAAQAHPLGNFTVNRYSRVELAGRQVDVLYVLDMAEIPTYRERRLIGREGQARWLSDTIARIERGVTLQVDGRRATLTPLKRQLAFPPGAAGLRTLRLEIVFGGPVAAEGRLGRVAELPRPGLRRPARLAGGRGAAGRRRAGGALERARAQREPGASGVPEELPADAALGQLGDGHVHAGERRRPGADPVVEEPTSTGPPRSTPAPTRASRS